MKKEIEIIKRKIANIEELQPYALLVLERAMKRKDKLGFPDKLAVESAKFVSNTSSVTDTNEYKKMLTTFRNVIIKSRKKVDEIRK